MTATESNVVLTAGFTALLIGAGVLAVSTVTVVALLIRARRRHDRETIEALIDATREEPLYVPDAWTEEYK